MTAPDLSIIIVNWNTCRLLRDCLASLAGSLGGLSSEIFVVDNASTDGSAAMVRDAFPTVQLVEAGGNLGFARANNLVLERTTARHVLLLNPDTVCPPGSLAAFVAAADRRPGCGGYGPVLTDPDGRPTISSGHFPSARFHWLRPLAGLPLGRRWRRWIRFTNVPDSGDPDREVDYVAGACLLIPRDVLAAVGPLDDRFFLYFEETDWCLRAWRSGRPIVLIGSAAVVHLEGRAAEQVSRFSLAQFQHSYRQYLAKNAGPGAVFNARLAQVWEKGLQTARHAVCCWSPRHRRLAARYAFETALQFRSDIKPTPPTST